MPDGNECGFTDHAILERDGLALRSLDRIADHMVWRDRQPAPDTCEHIIKKICLEVYTKTQISFMRFFIFCDTIDTYEY